MPEINFTCPNCRAEIEADESSAGAVVPCPNCNVTVMIPLQGISPGMRIAGYEVLRRLGSGGMGEVWLARHTSMDRQVALKILSPALTSNKEFVTRFIKEVQTAAKLEHQNIVTAFDAGVDNNIHYLAMSYIDGVLLDDMLRIERKIPEKEALQIIRCVAEALRYAWNEYKILHRDIKPANIMLDCRRIPKLMDMGISKSLAEEKKLTMTGIIVGTPYYMSPEQARADTDIDCRSDIYSLGATLYHLVTGEVPYDAPTTMGILTKHITDPFPPPQNRNPEVTDGCSALLEAMMAKKADDRPKTWEDVIKDIDLVLSGRFPATERPEIGRSAVMQRIPSNDINLRSTKGQFRKTELMDNDMTEIVPVPMRKNIRDRRIMYSALISIGIIVIIMIISASAFINAGGKGKNTSPEIKSNTTESANNAGTPIIEKTTATVSPSAIRTPEQLNSALKTANPDYKGDAKVEIDPADGQITSVSTDQKSLITDITPLKGLPLRRLELGKSHIPDLSPLEGMKLSILSISNNNRHLNINSLKGMPIETLNILFSDLNDTDMAVLEGMQPKTLGLNGNQNITNLDFTKHIGPQMSELFLNSTGITDLSPLKGRNIVCLSFAETKVSNISPLLGMPLLSLTCNNSKISDLSPLKGMKLKSLHILGTEVSDLSPLQGMPLSNLSCSNTKISDLSPLAGMKLRILHISSTDVSDIGALRGMPLTVLISHRCKNLTDIKVLSELKDLKTLTIPSHIKDFGFLRSLPNLEFIDSPTAPFTGGKMESRTAKQFWADYDAAKSAR